ncbi:MAG: C40 family peptidase [Bacteroidota bacterium]
MRRFFLISFSCLVTSCGIVKKKTTYAQKPKVTVEASEKVPSSTTKIPVVKEEKAVLPKADRIINTALTYSGVRYKYGGTTRKGMDCSGLLYVSFGEHNVALPRVSYEMASQGKRIRVKDIAKGDLLFFKTNKRGKRINHVGLVVAVANDEIKFIHSSASRGVIVSSLREGFWNYAFVKATRIL